MFPLKNLARKGLMFPPHKSAHNGLIQVEGDKEGWLALITLKNEEWSTLRDIN